MTIDKKNSTSWRCGELAITGTKQRTAERNTCTIPHQYLVGLKRKYLRFLYHRLKPARPTVEESQGETQISICCSGAESLPIPWYPPLLTTLRKMFSEVQKSEP